MLHKLSTSHLQGTGRSLSVVVVGAFISLEGSHGEFVEQEDSAGYVNNDRIEREVLVVLLNRMNQAGRSHNIERFSGDRQGEDWKPDSTTNKSVTRSRSWGNQTYCSTLRYSVPSKTTLNR